MNSQYVKQSSSVPAFAGCYKENDWTHRLHLCLQFNNIDSGVHARLQGYDVKRSWLTRLPKEVNDSCLLFQGAPDLIVKTNESEGIITTHEERPRAGILLTKRICLVAKAVGEFRLPIK